MKPFFHLVLLVSTAALLHAAPPPNFPLRVSEDRRHLTDSDGKPFLVVGDTAWSLIAQLDEGDIEKYLDDRMRRGFNSIIVNLLEHRFASRAPARIDGSAPFLKPGDFTRPNPEYFDLARRAVAAANRRGIVVWLCAAYLGWDGGDDGFFKEVKAAGPGALRSYGRFVGERFLDLPNIVWMVGGDFTPPLEDRWTLGELAEGLRERDPTRLMTAHAGAKSARAAFGDLPWLSVDTTYGYEKALHAPILEDHRRLPTKPFVLIETTYEGEHDAKPHEIRRNAWWAMLGGACGQFLGNNPIWHFDGPGLYPVRSSWQEALDSQGSRDVARLGVLLRGVPGHLLSPQPGNKLIGSGRGGGETWVAAAATPDGKLALLYFPSDGKESREVTLDLSSLAGPAVATWLNPARDSAPKPIDAPIPHREGQIIRTPGDNGTASNDWALLLDARGPSGGKPERP